MRVRSLGLCCVLALFVSLGTARADGKTSAAVEQDRVVAGGPHDFMETRHLVLRGTNEEIGRALALIAQERYGTQPARSSDPLRTRAQRHYFEKNYPVLYERMRGVAAAFGKNVDDDNYDFSGLGYTRIRAGCSVIYFPPETTADHVGLVSRDYDFSTGTLDGRRPPPGELSASARPYLIEMHPERGYASVALCAYDLLSGVLDGMNSEGLTVALLADDELMQRYPMEPTLGEPVAGLGVQQVPRMLLDTCATVEEAKEALLTAKQYYEFLPCHFLIADRHGKAFVWEFSQAHNREYIVENPGKPLVTTNFSLHAYLENGRPPSAEKAKSVCSRYCALTNRLTNHTDLLTVDFIKETHRLVDATASRRSPQSPPGRTLWHALYFPEQRRMQVSFYLGDEPGPAPPRGSHIRRSPYQEFTLETGRASR